MKCEVQFIPHGIASLFTLLLLTTATIFSASVQFNCSFILIEEWPTIDQYPNRSFVNGSLETGFFQYKRLNNITEETIDKLFENPRKTKPKKYGDRVIPEDSACLNYYENDGGEYPDPMKLNTLHHVAGFCSLFASVLAVTALLFYLPILCFPRDRLSLDCFCFLMALIFVFQFLTLLVYGQDNCTEINGISTTCSFSLGTYESMIAMCFWLVLVITTYYMPSAQVKLPEPVYYVSDQNYPQRYRAPEPEPEPEYQHPTRDDYPTYTSVPSGAKKTRSDDVSEITLSSMKYVSNDKLYGEDKLYKQGV